MAIIWVKTGEVNYLDDNSDLMVAESWQDDSGSVQTTQRRPDAPSLAPAVSQLPAQPAPAQNQTGT